MTLINAIRGHMAEFGVLAPAGPQHVGRLIERIADPQVELPAAARGALNVLADQLVELDSRIERLEADMRRRCREDADGARLLAVPGIGPITASAILAGVPHLPGFRAGRDFGVGLGLRTPVKTRRGNGLCGAI